jgi:hypothetical protein
MTVQSQSRTTADQPSFLQKHGPKLVAAAVWLLLVGGYGWYYRANGLTTETALLHIVNLLDSPFGPLLYILI